MLDTLAKKSQDPRVRTLPQPKRPAPASTPLVSFKKPKQNPQPSGQGRGKFKGKGNFSGQSAHRGKGRGAKGPGRSWRSDASVHEGTEGAPINHTNFGPIIRENSREAIKILGGLVRNRCRPLGHAHRTMGVQDPLCNAAPTETSGTGDHVPQGVIKVVISEPVSAGAAEQGSDRASSTHFYFYSRLFLVCKATGEWRPIIDLSSLNVFVHCPSFTMETPRSILRALHQGQWLTFLDLKDAYFHIGIDPADRRNLRFCHNGTAWQFTVLPFGLSTSPRVFTKILKPVLAYAHLHRVKLHRYIDDWLLNPGTHQEALEQTSWLRSLCQKLEKFDLIPSQVSTYLGIELDTSVGLARPSHKRLTNWLSVAEGFTAQQSPPAVQWLQVLGHLVSLEKLVPYGRIRIHPIQWQLRLQWSQSKEKSSKLIPLDLQSRLAILWWTNRDNLRRGIPIGTIDVEYYLYTDSSTQGWGAHLQDLTASGIWSQDQSQLHINVLELQAIWLGLRAFSQRVENARVALMSDNTSAVAYLRNQGGTKSLAMNDLATDICLWSEKRGMTLVPRYLPGHLNVLADHLSRRGQILKTDWSLNQTAADRIFHAWGRPFVDLFALGKNTKLTIYVSPIREETSWKVDSLVQNWDGLYAYAYPPTSLIRACLNKVRTENVEIVLIAPAWPNQEWFPDLLDLSIDFPITLPPVQKLLKQTFSHHFHPHPWLLNLHAWRLSKDSTRREDFLKRLPKGPLYLRDNPQRGFTNLSGKCLVPC